VKFGRDADWHAGCKVFADKFWPIQNWYEMKVLGEIQAQAKNILGPTLGTAMIVYIAYHAVQGERGLIAFWQLHRQVTQAELIHQGLTAEKGILENRVKLLNPNSLDRDMLEERVRFMLGYSRPDETILLKN